MKRKTSIWINLGLLALIALSVLGIFEEQAFAFLTEIAKKNSGFLLAVSEVNMVVSGISSIDLPFVSGTTTALETSLNKVQTYLLLTDTLSFLQVMLVSISKSWIFKALLIGLFILTLLEKKYNFFKKLLIIALALSPGLSIYTVAMNKVSQTASIDYGDKYLDELKETVQKVREENTLLNQQHEKNLTQIENGNKGGIEVLRKFREDVSYDLKKTDNSIKGDFKEIRTLIKSTGHEMTVKISRFCTMILFSLLILPICYSLIIYMLFKTFFSHLILAHDIGVQYRSAEHKVPASVKGSKSLLQKLSQIFIAIRTELKNSEERLEHSVYPSEPREEVQQVEAHIEQKENTTKTEAKTDPQPADTAPKVPVTEGKTTPPKVETTNPTPPKNQTEKTAAEPEKKTGNKDSRKKMKRSPGSILGT